MQLNSGFKEFGDLHTVVSSISEEKLQKADVSQRQQKTISAALQALQKTASLGQLATDPQVREAASKLLGRVKPLLQNSDASPELEGLAKDIAAVCTGIIGEPGRGAPRERADSFVAVRPRSVTRTRADSLTGVTPNRRMSISDASQLTKALQAERAGQLLSPRDNEFDAYELVHLADMRKFMAQDPGAPRPSEAQCKVFAQLLLKARGNMKVNQQMKEFLQVLEPTQSRRSSGVMPQNVPPRDVVHMMIEFSYRTKELPNPQQSVKQLQTLVDRFFDNKSVADESKLSMRDLGAIESFRKCGQACKMIRELNLGKYDPSGDLDAIARANHKAGLLISHVENSLERRTNFRPGDILSTVPERVAKLRAKEETGQMQVRIQGGVPVVHTAVLFRAEDGTEKQSHIVDQLVVDDFGLYDRLSSVAVRIDPMVLYQGNGSPNPNEVAQQFQDITSAMHQNVKPDEVQLPNSSLSKLKAGVASLLPVLTKTVSSKKEGDWTKEFNALVQSKPGERPQNDMICSAWGALSQAAAFDQLNVPGQKPQFRNPFPSNKNLNLMTPASLLQQLIAVGCVSVVQPEPVLAAIIKADELKLPDGIAKLFVGQASIPTVNTPSTPVAVELEEVDSPFAEPAKRPAGQLESKWVSANDHARASETIALYKPDQVCQQIVERRLEVETKVTETRKFIESHKDETHLRKYATQLLNPERSRGKCRAVEGGTGGVYRVSGTRKGSRESVKMIVKPDDEAPLCLNNGKGNASPLRGKLLRDHIPLGNDAMRARLTYVVSASLGLDCTPKTEVAILQSARFHDVTDGLSPARPELGAKPPEKVCSVQKFVDGAITIEDYQALAKEKMDKQDYTVDVVMDRLVDSIDQQSIEDAALLCCISGETDGNTGNLLLVPKEGPSGHTGPYYRMMKIDNSLCWPEKNGEFSVFLQGVSALSGRPLGDQTVDRIRFLPTEKIMKELRDHGMGENVVTAAVERIKIMQAVVMHHGATLEHLLTSIEKGRDILEVKDQDKIDAEGDALLMGVLGDGGSTFVARNDTIIK